MFLVVWVFFFVGFVFVGFVFDDFVLVGLVLVSLVLVGLVWVGLVSGFEFSQREEGDSNDFLPSP